VPEPERLKVGSGGERKGMVCGVSVSVCVESVSVCMCLCAECGAVLLGY